MRDSELEELRRLLDGLPPDHKLTIAAGPPLPPGFNSAAGKHPLFFRDWKWKKSLCARESVEMFPDVLTLSPEYLRFLTESVSLGLDNLKVELDEEGFVGPSGVHKDVGSFGTVSGFRQAPVAYPLRSNHILRESLGLPNEWRRERDRTIYREWLHLFFSQWADRIIRIAAKSKSGPPFMTYSPGVKVNLVEERLQLDTLNKILKKITKQDYRGLRKDHQCCGFGTVGRRGQSDAAGKVRSVATEEYARTGGRSGQMINADKRVIVDGVVYDTLAGQRVRPIIGYSVVLNTIGQIMSSGHQHAAYERFPKVLKFTDVQTKLDELCAEFLPGEERLTAFFADVVNFDASALPEFRFREILDVWGQYWDGGLVDLQEMLHRAPYCTAPLELDGKFYWSGNPDDPSAYDGEGSLKSGDNIVTIVGIIEMVGDYLTNCDYAFGNVVGNVESIMRGEHHTRLWDKGDDHGVWGNPASVARYEEIATAVIDGKMAYSYFKVEAEPGKQFTGAVIQRRGPRAFKALPRLHSLHEKSYANEHSVNSVFRPVWPIGAFARKELYGAAPQYQTYVDLIDESWDRSGCKRIYGTLNAIIDKGMEETQTFWRLAQTPIDYTVLFSPAKANYRFTDDEISPDILKLFKRDISHDLTRGIADTMYGGRILEMKNG